jgi:hypothetical protein
MSDQQKRAHTIRFSFDNNRLNISMEVLHFLGNPRYIQVFVSCDRKSLFIRGCENKETPCFSVPPRVYSDTEYKYVLRKAAFSEAIRSVTGWDQQGRYRLHGVAVSHQVMGFAFSEAERLDGDDSP